MREIKNSKVDVDFKSVQHSFLLPNKMWTIFSRNSAILCELKIKSIRNVHTKTEVPFIRTGCPVTTLPTHYHHTKHSCKTDCATFQRIPKNLYLVTIISGTCTTEWTCTCNGLHSHCLMLSFYQHQLQVVDQICLERNVAHYV